MSVDALLQALEKNPAVPKFVVVGTFKDAVIFRLDHKSGLGKLTQFLSFCVRHGYALTEFHDSSGLFTLTRGNHYRLSHEEPTNV